MQIAMESVASARGLMVIPNRDMLPSSSLLLLLLDAPPRMMIGAASSLVVDVDVLSFDCDVAARITFDLDLRVVPDDDDPPPRAIVATYLAGSFFKLSLPF